MPRYRTIEPLGACRPLSEYRRATKGPIAATREGMLETALVIIEESPRSFDTYLVYRAERGGKIVERGRKDIPICTLVRAEVRDLVRLGSCVSGHTKYIKSVDKVGKRSTIVNKKEITDD